jgi:hypothetical protein
MIYSNTPNYGATGRFLDSMNRQLFTVAFPVHNADLGSTPIMAENTPCLDMRRTELEGPYGHQLKILTPESKSESEGCDPAVPARDSDGGTRLSQDDSSAVESFLGETANLRFIMGSCVEYTSHNGPFVMAHMQNDQAEKSFSCSVGSDRD